MKNGDYLVGSPYWNDARGAVTWGNGNTGVTGIVSAANSLVGSNPREEVGGLEGPVYDPGPYLDVQFLSNGNYVIVTPYWHGGGAVTWADGSSGISGMITDANSLVGNPGDYVGPYVVPLSNGNYVVASPGWNGGYSRGRGAVTWGNGKTGTSGIVSEANSLVGSNPGDQVGYAVTALSNGNYVVLSPSWNGSRGAATWGNGTSGQTLDGQGTVTPQNSIVGHATSASLRNVLDNRTDQTFLTTFATEGQGRITVGIADPGQLTYSAAQSQSLTITPDFLTRTLDTGTDVVLQASNDITVNSPITVSAGGKGGALTLQAGRSIVLNASISTDNGALTLIANDQQANGVVDGERDPGSAVIRMASGTVLDTGLAALTVELRDGAGLSNPQSGPIILQSVAAGTVTVVNKGPSPGSDLLFGNVTSRGPQRYASLHGTTFLSGKFTARDSAITLSNAVLLVPGGTLDAGASTVNLAGGALTLIPGQVTILSGLVLNDATTVSATLLPGIYSELLVNGPINLADSTLNLLLGFEPPVGSSFEIVTNTGSAPITGTFYGLAEGATLSQGGNPFQITYQGGTGGHSVVLTRLA
jgi:hypothetical protein